MGWIMVSMLQLQAQNEATQLKIRSEINSEKEDSGISIIVTTTEKSMKVLREALEKEAKEQKLNR
jgi:acylphosphatase